MTFLHKSISKNFLLKIFGEHLESFESLVDLFTILSFVLIASAFFFGINKAQMLEKNVTANFELREIAKGAAPAPEIPDDVVIILIENENGSDFLIFFEEGNKKERYPLSNVNIDSILQLELQGRITKNINLVILEKASTTTYKIFFDIQKWLTVNGFTNVIINFDT
jgi:hypothetical protein